jgi:transcriptional regulator with XRE-family HTH domain
MNYYRIKIELETRGITVKDFCKQINLTEQGLYQMIRNESMKVDVLERISEALKVPVSYWFDIEDSIIDETTAVQKKNDNNETTTAKQIDTVTNELNKLLKGLSRK